MEMLPPETLELVLADLNRGELCRILTTSALFHQSAARLLYRAPKLPVQQIPRLLKTLANNDIYPPLVRQLDLEWIENILTANLLRLLHRALRRLVHLTHLGLDFSTSDNPSSFAWILADCPFSLRVFSTSMRCDPALARFLESQPALTDICLRGFHPAPSIPLSPTALPRLSHFRTVLAAADVTADFVRNRPVESVSMSLHPGDPTASLDALLLSARPVKRLTVMSFDAAPPAVLIADIAARLPALEALHAVILLRSSTHASQLLVETAPALSHFKALRYLTFMAPGSREAAHDESEIATLWHEACPTLKTIILPRGIVWGYVDGRWMSLENREVQGTSSGTDQPSQGT